jgi:hypothetical protein
MTMRLCISISSSVLFTKPSLSRNCVPLLRLASVRCAGARKKRSVRKRCRRWLQGETGGWRRDGAEVGEDEPALASPVALLLKDAAQCDRRLWPENLASHVDTLLDNGDRAGGEESPLDFRWDKEKERIDATTGPLKEEECQQ